MGSLDKEVRHRGKEIEGAVGVRKQATGWKYGRRHELGDEGGAPMPARSYLDPALKDSEVAVGKYMRGRLHETINRARL